MLDRIEPADTKIGIDPGGITRSSSTTRMPATVDAMSVTTTAWTISPPKIVSDFAPSAFSTPYRLSRSTVSSAKNSPITTNATTIVTPMIWLKVPCCSSTPGIALTASSTV